MTTIYPCEGCECRNYSYNMAKTITADGRASELKAIAKLGFHISTGFVGHLTATENRCDCGHRKDDHPPHDIPSFDSFLW